MPHESKRAEEHRHSTHSAGHPLEDNTWQLGGRLLSEKDCLKVLPRAVSKAAAWIFLSTTVRRLPVISNVQDLGSDHAVRFIARLSVEAEGKNLGFPHEACRRVLSQLRSNEARLESVIRGHSSVTITERYSHLSPSVLDEAITFASASSPTHGPIAKWVDSGTSRNPLARHAGVARGFARRAEPSDRPTAGRDSPKG